MNESVRLEGVLKRALPPGGMDGGVRECDVQQSIRVTEGRGMGGVWRHHEWVSGEW